MILYYDNRFETVRFGIRQLKQALEKAGVFFVERNLRCFTGPSAVKAVVASFAAPGICPLPEAVGEEGFAVSMEKNIVYVTGRDPIGLMYGLMDLAETIALFGIDKVAEKRESPFMKLRGVKFNLPFEPYDMGDPFEKNVETCKRVDFWREYIDFLASHRYNCLSLWSEHPFHMLFRLDKYPQTCPYADAELETYKQLFKFIFRHAKNRGIAVYMITWNIRLTPFVAAGLGLPEEMGDMADQYNVVYDRSNGIPNNTAEFDALRQHSAVVKDYFKECIKALITTYRDLTGIGTTSSEEMVGTAEERQQWVADTYLAAVKEAGRDIAFIHRTNMSNGKITKQIFLDQYPGDKKYMSWKYSNAHMYSHVRPKFEALWKAWEGMEVNGVKLIYTVRNDDIHTLRWGDPDYIRDYIKGMDAPHVHGYYWGADGYLWAEDFQHVNHKHKTWEYDFQRQWYQFELLGRLGYNPELPHGLWIEKFKRHYSEQWGEAVFAMLQAASGIIPAVNRLFWINYDFQWHPESLLSVYGFKSILDFMDGKPMPGIGTLGIREYADCMGAGKAPCEETPDDIIRLLDKAAGSVREGLAQLEPRIPREYRDGELGCTLEDLKAWAELGSYYKNKFSAALKLVLYEKHGRQEDRDEALALLREGAVCWRRLSEIGAGHYMPYKMARTKQIFGWSYYIDEVERDIVLAAGVEPGKKPDTLIV